MARKTGFVRRGGRMVRETLWLAIGPTSNTFGTVGAPVLFTGFSAIILDLRPFTVVRTRGEFYVGSDQESADERYAASIGMAIVSD